MSQSSVLRELRSRRRQRWWNNPLSLQDPEGLPKQAMTTGQRRYLAYMLRLWQVDSGEEPVWRASLESPHTGERRSFANLEMLFAFLEEHTRGRARPAQLTDTGETETDALNRVD